MTTTYTTKSASQMEQELADRINELNQFVYHVSHDLMAPLCSIKGLLDLIAKCIQNPGSNFVNIVGIR